MKILAGELRGRSFEQPKSQLVRPLSDKVRAAIFDITGIPKEAVVLDAYAGSGGAGFEALSRGAAMVEAIEADVRTARTIEANAHMLGLDWGYMLHTIKVETWLALPANRPQNMNQLVKPRYHIVIADPPYAKLETDILNRLVSFVRPGGVLVVSHSSKLNSPVVSSGQLVRHKEYGDTALSFYQPIEKQADVVEW